MILRGIDGNDYAIVLRSSEGDTIKYFEAHAGAYEQDSRFPYRVGKLVSPELVCSVTIPVRPTKTLKEAAKAELFRLLREAGRVCETPIELEP